MAKKNQLTREALLAWLAKQPPETAYDYTESSKCLVAQYLKSIEAENTDLYSEEIMRLFGDSTFLVRDPQNFGAALERARAGIR